MTSQKIIHTREAAVRHYANGYCCSEATVLALAEMQKIESSLVPGMATAFCGGIASTGGICGAITGAVMGISLALGRSAPDESREKVFAATKQLLSEFEQVFGFRNCSELKGLVRHGTNGTAKEGSGRSNSPCAAYTGTAAEIAARILCELGNSTRS